MDADVCYILNSFCDIPHTTPVYLIFLRDIEWQFMQMHYLQSLCSSEGFAFIFHIHALLKLC